MHKRRKPIDSKRWWKQIMFRCCKTLQAENRATVIAHHQGFSGLFLILRCTNLSVSVAFSFSSFSTKSFGLFVSYKWAAHSSYRTSMSACLGPLEMLSHQIIGNSFCYTKSALKTWEQHQVGRDSEERLVVSNLHDVRERQCKCAFLGESCSVPSERTSSKWSIVWIWGLYRTLTLTKSCFREAIVLGTGELVRSRAKRIKSLSVRTLWVERWRYDDQNAFPWDRFQTKAGANP